MSKSHPFPALNGGCFCGQTRFRLETAPLYCYACHCADCHKHTGSVFACFASIEADLITSTGVSPPKIHTTIRPSGILRHLASCAKCETQLWASGDTTPVTVDVKVGALDLPELMEPDIHEFIESKIPWVILPEGANTCKGPFDFRKVWPKSSMRRYEAAVKRAEQRIQNKREKAKQAESEDEKETDKTPTAQSPEEKEDDEAFEKRYQETEKILQARLEQLSLKLKEEEKSKDAHEQRTAVYLEPS